MIGVETANEGTAMPFPRFISHPPHLSTNSRIRVSLPSPFSAEKGTRASSSVSSRVSRISASAGST